jgi:hypothetical protein
MTPTQTIDAGLALGALNVAHLTLHNSASSCI